MRARHGMKAWHAFSTISILVLLCIRDTCHGHSSISTIIDSTPPPVINHACKTSAYFRKLIIEQVVNHLHSQNQIDTLAISIETWLGGGGCCSTPPYNHYHTSSCLLFVFFISACLLYTWYVCMYVCIYWSGRDKVPKKDHIGGENRIKRKIYE